MSDFSQLVKSVKETTGTRGFGARKRAAAQIIGSEIEALGPLTGVTGQILADLTVETDRVGKATDPEELKEISNRLREYKGIINQTYKQLGDESKFSKTQADNLRKLITTSQRNIKKAGKGLFGSANESFLDSLTDTLNPFTKIGEVIGQLPGGAPFEAYFNTLGDGLSDKIKGYFGIGGLTDDNVDKVEQYVSGKQDLEQTQADYEDSRPKTKSDFVSDPTESNEQGLQAKDILLPPVGMLARMRRTLAFGLGLTDKSGQSFLLKISEALEGRDPSATEGKNVMPGDGDDGIEMPMGDDKKGKGGIFGMLGGLMGAAGTALATGITALGVAIRGLAGGVMMLANPIALLGLAAFTAAVIGIGFALKIAAPGRKVFAKAIVEINSHSYNRFYII